MFIYQARRGVYILLKITVLDFNLFSILSYDLQWTDDFSHLPPCLLSGAQASCFP
jgi:hypothetical protein